MQPRPIAAVTRFRVETSVAWRGRAKLEATHGGLRAIPDRCDIVRLAVSGKTLLVVSCKVMSSSTHISTLYREFADALRDVLAENAVGLASRGRLARTRAAVKKHPDYSERLDHLGLG